MAEKQEFEVGLEYTSVGAAKVQADLDKLLDKIDQYARDGKKVADVQDQISSGLEKVGRSARQTASNISSASKEVRSSVEGWKELKREINATSKAMREAAMGDVVSGLTDSPLLDASRTRDLSWAKEVKAAYEAEGLTALQVANRIISQEKSKQAEIRRTAEARKTGLGSRDYSNLSVNYDAGIEARQREAKAWSAVLQARMKDEVAAEKQAAANNRVTQSVNAQAASLPTLRYALYDVASTLGIAGTALTGFSALSFKAAIDYERAFANVIRTNDSLMTSQVAASRAFESFVDLASELPMSFQNLTEIGTLAGQLGVAAGRMEDFTRTTAQFSTVTEESIDTTATAFGRLDALLPDVQGNYDALGSSILNVGINSVATEGEVIKITTQLAGVGRQAGLTSADVIGLSGALASVGVQPELARGTITRLFGQISRAVAVGGENLEGFARIAGTSASDFESKWGSAPMEAVLDIFRGIRDRGAEAESALRAVGITSVRDVPAILRLAQTMDSVLVPALADARDGFEDGTQLSENYGVIVETTAAKIQILVNNFQSLMATLGESATVFKGVIDLANDFLVWARELQKNPLTATFSQLAVVITAVSGVLLLLMAGLTRGVAGMIAFRTAMSEAGVTATGLSGQLTALTGSLVGVNTQTALGSTGMQKLSGVMKGMGVASAALVAIPIVMWFRDWIAELNNAVVDTDTLVASLSRIDAGISDKVSQDIQDVLNKSLESLGASTQTAASAAFIPIVGAYTEAVKSAAYAAETEFDLGLERLGMKATNWWTTDLVTGEPAWLAGFFDASYEELDKFEEAWIQAWEGASSETQKQALVDALADLETSVVDAGGTSEDFRYNLSDLYDVMGSGVDQTQLAAEQNQALADSYGELRDEMMQLVDDVYSTVNAQFDLQRVLAEVGESFYNEGAAVASLGSSIQDAIKAIVDQSGSAGAAAANLQVFFDYLVKGGYASAAQLTHLQQVIRGLTASAGGKISAPTLDIPDFSSFASGMSRAASSAQRAAPAVREVREEVRTLTDYASDLSSVWNRAFDIRFSSGQATDSITKQFIEIRKAALDAAKAIEEHRMRIRELRTEGQSLQSERSLLAYYKSIADAYGDVARSQQLAAKIAELDTKIAKNKKEVSDENKELKKTQDSQSKSLEGNSEQAIKNRETILNLVKSYQDLMEKYAASGMSQEELARKSVELKNKFIEQATQLGFNRKEVEKYASAFDDVSAAIARVPRNVTVSANVNPAIQAFNEFSARANKQINSVRANASKPVNMPITTSADLGGLFRAERARLAFMEAELQKAINTGGSYSTINMLSTEIVRLRNLLKAYGGYASGGYTGPGGKNQPAGIVHRGEYVIPKRDVNQVTGMPYSDALGRLMNGVRGYSGGGYVRPAASSSGVGVVSLTAGTIQQIANAVRPHLFLDGQQVAQAVGKAFTHSTQVGGS